MPTFRKRSEMPVPAEEVYDWHSNPGALERLLPPWEKIKIIERQGGIDEGDRTVIRIWKGPVPLRWEAVAPSPGARPQLRR